MAPQHLPVFRSTFDGETLIDSVLTHYDLGTAITCTLWQRGINDSYRVTASKGQWILRVSAVQGYSVEEITAELDLLRILADGRIVVPTAIPRRDGSLVGVIDAPEGPRPVVLLRYLEGETRPRLTPKQGERYGQALARLHIVADQKAPSLNRPHHDRRYFVDTPLARLRGFVPLRLFPDQLDFIAEAAETLWTHAETLPKEAPHYGLCHGDLMRGNALVTSKGQIAILDFDFCGYGWRVYDIGTFIWAEVYDGFTIDWESQHDIYRAFLAGYQSVRCLTTAERHALPCFAGLRQLFLFGSAIHNAPAFGVGWMGGSRWIDRSVEFIKVCLSGEWLAKVGLA